MDQASNAAVVPIVLSHSERSDMMMMEEVSSSTLRIASTDVLGPEEIVVGAAIAFGLAFMASFLQGRRSQNDFVLWEKEEKQQEEGPFVGNATRSSTSTNSSSSTVFSEDDWNEIRQPDKYLMYKNKATAAMRRRRIKEEETRTGGDSRPVGKKNDERAWALVALLCLFVPIFSIEFFFALSRQVICDGNPITQGDYANFLCSPAPIR